MAMVDFPLDHVSHQNPNPNETRRQTCRRQTHGQTQTCVSRTEARLTARHMKPDGRATLMFCRCFMFQMFHAPPPSRARDFLSRPSAVQGAQQKRQPGARAHAPGRASE